MYLDDIEPLSTKITLIFFIFSFYCVIVVCFPQDFRLKQNMLNQCLL